MRKILVLVFFVFSILSAFSQTREEKDIQKTADKHFKAKEFAVAEKFYSQLVSTNPQNADYNFKYGACLVNNGERRAEALQYLKFAVDQSADNLALYYLGRAYQVSYQYAEAIVAYNKYKSVAKSSDIVAYDVDLHIKECETSQTLIKNMYPLKVLSSKTMRRDQFFRAYELSGHSMKVLVKPRDFQLPEDEKSKSTDPLLVVTYNIQKSILFSAHRYGGKFGELDRNLYWVKKTEDGTWSDFQDVGPFINTNFDEDFPYLHPNGKELYFSSKGHGGLGGYDIFKSTLDSVTGLWGKPENLGFSVNSPFDDILYIVDQYDKVAYFASNRDNSGTEINVYKIVSPSYRDNFAVYRGEIKLVAKNTNKAKISVLDAKGNPTANYYSDDKTGHFIIPLAELENHILEFTSPDSIKQRINLRAPSKSEKEVVAMNVKFESYPNKKISYEIKDDYQLTTVERVAIYDHLGSLIQNQNSDAILFGIRDSTKNSFSETAFQTDVADKNLITSLSQFTPRDAKIFAGESKESTSKEIIEVKKQIVGAYQLAEAEQHKATALKAELDELKYKSTAKKPEVQEEINAKLNLYNQSLGKIKNTLQYADKQENQLLLKNKEELLLGEYIKVLEQQLESGNSQNLSAEISDKKTKIEEEYDVLVKNGLSTGSAAENDAKLSALKKQRSDLQNKIYLHNSSVALMDEEILADSKEMSSTKSSARISELALNVGELESQKKKKKAAILPLEEQLADVSKEMEELAVSLNMDVSIKNMNAANGTKSLSNAERLKIVENAKTLVQDGSLEALTLNDEQIDFDQVFASVENDGDQSTSEAGGNVVNADGSVKALNQVNVETVSVSEREKLSEQYLDLPLNAASPSEVNSTNEKQKNQLLVEALLLQQQIDSKNRQLLSSTNPEDKKRLQNEIAQAQAQLLEKELQIVNIQEEINNARYLDNQKKIDASLSGNKKGNSEASRSKSNEIKQSWLRIKDLKSLKDQAATTEEKLKFGKEILTVQTHIIQQQTDLDKQIVPPAGKNKEDVIAANGEGINASEVENTESQVQNIVPETRENINLAKKNAKKNQPKNAGNKATTNTEKTGRTKNGATTSANNINVSEGVLFTPNISYDENTVIPLDVELPEGLVYKVQVGAFRNKINPAIFDGMAPLTGETTKTGIIRYTAGFFKSFKAADMAKGRIRNMGYQDAFVVCFYNGKRISVEEAEQKVAELAPAEKKAYDSKKTEEVNKLLKAGIREDEAFITSTNVPNPIETFGAVTTNDPEPVLDKSKSLKTVTGVYFTVQIGVFSTAKSSADLLGITDIYSIPSGTGLIRYSTGVFRNLNEALAKKEEVIAIGIKDAYVVAYQNGERISIQEAQKLK